MIARWTTQKEIGSNTEFQGAIFERATTASTSYAGFVSGSSLALEVGLGTFCTDDAGDNGMLNRSQSFRRDLLDWIQLVTPRF